MKKLALLSLFSIFAMTSCWNSGESNSSTSSYLANKNESFKNKEKNLCEYCGREFDNIQDMAINSCKKHPDGTYEGSHKLYEGTTKSKYECKYCGKTAKTIMDLVSSKCKHSPDNGWHRPRL